jgi:hypothetical protein
MKTETETWNIRIQLGNWMGYVQLPKDALPEAIDAHSFAIDAIKSSAHEQGLTEEYSNIRMVDYRSCKEGK